MCYSEGCWQVNYLQQPKTWPVSGEGPLHSHHNEGHYHGAAFLIHCTPVCVFECGNEGHAYGEDVGTSAIAITHMMNANVQCQHCTLHVGVNIAPYFLHHLDRV